VKGLLLQAALCLSGIALATPGAAPWSLGEPVTVSGAGGSPRYHHLDGAGRQHVAASATEVALIWEDDHTGAPQVYLAVKPRLAETFRRTEQLSTGKEAYEPAIASLGQGRWLAAWEQDAAVVARVIDADGLGPVATLAAKGGRQVTLTADPSGRVAAVWARALDAGQIIEAAELRPVGRDLGLAGAAMPVSPVDHRPYQAFPAATWGPDGRLLVAWEDRRAGHTRLFHSWREPGQAFAPAQQLNQHFAPTSGGPENNGADKGLDKGLGTGVMRVMLSADATGAVQAIWLDKRHAASGYAVWGAASADGGRRFGPNQIVQDDLGAAVQQWHAALAGGKPGFVAAWDDTREAWGDADETGDVLLSWRTDTDTGWSADLVVPGASGEGYQGSPAVALDPEGDLHLIWIVRDDLSSPSRLRYLRGDLGG
jgi:hypothetical protein